MQRHCGRNYVTRSYVTDVGKFFKLPSLELLDLDFIETTELLIRKLSSFPQLVLIRKLHHLLDWVEK
jgi:hypothetical protein